MPEPKPVPRSVTFTVPGVARPKGSWRAVPHFATGRTIFKPDNANSKDWQDQVSWAARQLMRHQLGGPLVLIVTFYLPRPKSVGLAYPTSKPDLDKLIRNIADALTGILYADDAQIVDCIAFKRYAIDGAQTTITVSQQVEEMEP